MAFSELVRGSMNDSAGVLHGAAAEAQYKSCGIMKGKHEVFVVTIKRPSR